MTTAAATAVKTKATPVGLEPTRGDSIGLAGRRLDRSAKVSLALQDRPPLHDEAAHIKCNHVGVQAELENARPPFFEWRCQFPRTLQNIEEA